MDGWEPPVVECAVILFVDMMGFFGRPRPAEGLGPPKQKGGNEPSQRSQAGCGAVRKACGAVYGSFDPSLAFHNSSETRVAAV